MALHLTRFSGFRGHGESEAQKGQSLATPLESGTLPFRCTAQATSGNLVSQKHTANSFYLEINRQILG